MMCSVIPRSLHRSYFSRSMACFLFGLCQNHDPYSQACLPQTTSSSRPIDVLSRFRTDSIPNTCSIKTQRYCSDLDVPVLAHLGQPLPCCSVFGFVLHSKPHFLHRTETLTLDFTYVPVISIKGYILLMDLQNSSWVFGRDFLQRGHPSPRHDLLEITASHSWPHFPSHQTLLLELPCMLVT